DIRRCWRRRRRWWRGRRWWRRRRWWSARFWNDRRVAADRAGRSVDVRRRANHDLIDFGAVLAHLHPKRMRPGRREPHIAGIGEPICVALPAPSDALTRRAAPQVDDVAAARADAIDGIPRRIDAVGEL